MISIFWALERNFVPEGNRVHGNGTAWSTASFLVALFNNVQVSKGSGSSESWRYPSVLALFIHVTEQQNRSRVRAPETKNCTDMNHNQSLRYGVLIHNGPLGGDTQPRTTDPCSLIPQGRAVSAELGFSAVWRGTPFGGKQTNIMAMPCK